MCKMLPELAKRLEDLQEVRPRQPVLTLDFAVQVRSALAQLGRDTRISDLYRWTSSQYYLDKSDQPVMWRNFLVGLTPAQKKALSGAFHIFPREYDLQAFTVEDIAGLDLGQLNKLSAVRTLGEKRTLFLKIACSTEPLLSE